MKQFFKFSFMGIKKPCLLCASISVHLVRLENETGLKFEPTGLNDDSFGRSFINGHRDLFSVEGSGIYSMQSLKKDINFWKRCGVDILTGKQR